jgi:predicted CopG family antitoxin
MHKTRLNISIDQDIADFAKDFASENRTTVSDIITQYFLAVKRRKEGETAERILADPAFSAALEEMHEKLKAGKARWHSYDEVFGG